MRGIRSVRVAALGLVTILLLMTGAQSTLGAELVKDEGRTGNSQIGEPGGRCIYDSLILQKVRGFAPTVYGDYVASTWVGWRMKVLHQTNSSAPWKVVHQSPWQKDKATNKVAADGFTRIDWNVPSDPVGTYEIQIVVAFYSPGSKTNIEGRTVWSPTWYRISTDGQVVWCVAED